jgi:hypothetical protein
MNSDDLSNFDAPPPEESSNRTFLIALVFWAASCFCPSRLAGILLYRPSQAAQQAGRCTGVQNAQVAAVTRLAGHEPSVSDRDAA